MDNKDQATWDAYRKSLERPNAIFVGWQNAEGAQFSMCASLPTWPRGSRHLH